MDSTRASDETLAWILISGELDIDAGIAAAARAAALPILFGSSIHDFDHNVPAEHSLGVAWLRKGDPKKAVEYLTLAASMLPDRDAIKRDLARARELAAQTP